MGPWDWDDADIGGGIEIPTGGGGGIDWGGAWETAGKVFGTVAGAAATIYKTRNELALTRENNAIKLQQNTLANQLAITQASGAVDIAKARVGAEVAKANLQSQLASYLPFTGSGSSGGLSLTTIAIMAAAGFAVYKFAK